MPLKLKRGLLVVALIVGAIGLSAGLSRLKPPPETKEQTSLATLVEVLTLSRESIDFRVSSQGTVRPRTETIVSAEVPGAIVSVSPKLIPGGMFEAGEELMRIDPTNYEAAVAEAEAVLTQRQIEFDGAEKLRKQGYRAETEFASAAAALAAAEAALVRAARNLERTSIRLPYAGMVRTKDADLGQYVNVGTRLGVAFSTEVAEVRLPLTDSDLAFLELPDPATVSAEIDAAGAKVTLAAKQQGQRSAWNAAIVRTEGVVDETTRVTFAVAEVRDPYLRQAATSDRRVLPMGTFVTASIEGKTLEDVIRVPRAAVRGNGQVVVINDENRVEVRNVESIRTDADYVYVRSGVSAGERVSLTVMENPINGMLVRTSSASPESTAASGSP